MLRALSIVVAALLLASCSAPRQLSEDERAHILARAEARWTALENYDFAAAYEYMSPAYRDVFTASMYEKRFYGMVRWELTSVEFVNYDARAAVASVAVWVMTSPVKPTSVASEAIGAVPTKTVEQWILQDGEWWYSANL